MTGIRTLVASGMRIGDYVLGRELPATPVELAFEAAHVLLPRRVRLVVVHPAFAGLHAVAVQLMREACILEALRHPTVPRMYECGLLDDRRPWVASELLDGPTLADLTAERPLSVGSVISLLHDVAAILEHAHGRGVIHGGLCPELIVQGADGLRIATWASAVADPEGDGRVDVHALGVVAYMALTLAEPTISAVRRCPGAPARLTSLLDRMLASSLDARPSMTEVRVEAANLAEHIEVYRLEDDGTPVEEVDVVLVDISHDPPPIPRGTKVRWTPAEMYLQGAAAPPIPIELVDLDPLDPRRKRT